MMPTMARVRQFVAVMSRRDPAFRHDRTAPGAYLAWFGRRTKSIRPRIQVDPGQPGAWVRPAIIGGVVVVGLVALSVWLLSPNNPESIAGQEPDYYLIDNVAFHSPAGRCAAADPPRRATLPQELHPRCRLQERVVDHRRATAH